MKMMSLIFCCCFFHQGWAQCDTSIMGKWKVLATKQNGIYYDARNDSIAAEGQAAQMLATPAGKNALREMMSASIYMMVFDFRKNYTLYWTLVESITDTLTYCYDPQKKLLETKSAHSTGEATVDTAAAILKRGLLLLRFNTEDIQAEFLLKRISD